MAISKKNDTAREAFSGQRAFILAAIGSAVGLGNIWRFPYVTYENGGGAFIIPYIVALLTAGIPLLFLDYAIGRKYRGSPPLAFQRIAKKLEFMGWWQVLICFVIAVYYAVIIAWAVCYTYFSITKAWGADPSAFFFQQYLKMSDNAEISFDFVQQITWSLIGVWAFCIFLLALGVQKGIAKSSIISMPILVVMFGALVIFSLFLPNASEGLNSLFTPNWEKLTDASVWVAAYGQIFFSLSVGFGIMITYASYLKAKENATGSGLVVAFANSSFEILAGIGVFAALGFMAMSVGKPVSEVATSGIGLAFIAFPTIINESPLGELVGILFFGSLVFAGFTSLISIMEVVIAAVQDKLQIGRIKATLGVGIPMAAVSVLLFPTSTGLSVLDVVDKFVNDFGVVFVALLYIVTLTYFIRALQELRSHLNQTSSFLLGLKWQICVGFITPAVLSYLLITQAFQVLDESYGGYPHWFINIFGWGMVLSLPIISLLLSRLPWKNNITLDNKSID